MPADDNRAGGAERRIKKTYSMSKGENNKTNQMIKSEKGLPRTKDMDFWRGAMFCLGMARGQAVLFRGTAQRGDM